MTKPSLTVVGDGIENPWNVRTLLAAAEMFAAGCTFRVQARLAQSYFDAALDIRENPLVTVQEIAALYAPILALDNVSGAADVYDYRPPPGHTPALVVGNERRGISHDLLARAAAAIQIPMPSRHLNCLNVAAATAVALYYLTGLGGRKQRVVMHPESRRPAILLFAPGDHVELGSTIRSAGAFGWQQVFVADHHGVWFGVDRAQRAEGRAAARRARNPIRVIPVTGEQRYAFEDVCVVTPAVEGMPLSRTNLALGPRQLVVIPDMTAIALGEVDWDRYGRRVSFASLDLPARSRNPHYRLDASIVLAEVGRQVGRPPSQVARRRPPQAPRYYRALELGPLVEGEIVYLDDLEDY